MWTIAIVGVGLLGLAAIVVPFLGGMRPWEVEETSDLDRLLAKKARVLRSIKDLDHEREAGLLSEEDWQETRQEYLDEAVRLNRDIAERTGIAAAAEEPAR